MDYGIRISKDNKDAVDGVLADMGLDSRYSNLMLLEKKTLTFTAEQGELSPTGTATYNHGLGYAPFVIGVVDYTAASTEFKNGPIPYNYTVDPGGAFSGHFLFSSITMDIDTTKIDVDWQTIELLPGEEFNLAGDVNYTVTLHIYSYELGSLTS